MKGWKSICLLLAIVLALGVDLSAVAPARAAGGRWQRVQGYKAVHFVDRDHGWVVGLDGMIMHTANGGTGWQAQDSGTSAQLRAVYFFDLARGWAVGSGGTIVATADGGNTWEPQSSGTTKSLYGVHFVDAAHGWAVGSNGSILATSNGGST